MPSEYLVTIRRVELITFNVEAESSQDAENRVLMDGDEIASRTESITTVSVEHGA